MAAVGTYLSYLGYINTIEENGVVKARLNFQANDRFGNLSVGKIGNVDFSDDMPSFISPGSNIKYEVESLGYESITATGVLKIYPLTANTSYTMQGYDSAMTPTAEVSFTATPTNNNPKAKDLASGTLAESVSASTTTLLVYVGEGSASTIKAVWPDCPFYASIMPASPSAGVPNSLDSEIVKVTAVGNDQVGNTALTVTRAQRGTTGKAFTAGAIVTNANYAEDAVLLGDEGTAETPTPWITTDDILDGAITGDKLDWGSIVEVVGTDTNRCWKFANGLMIAAVKKTASITFSQWNAIYESEVIYPPDYAVAFAAIPVATYSILSSPLQAWPGQGSGRSAQSNFNGTTTRAPGLVLMRDGSGSGSYTIGWIAVGRWK